MGLFMIREILSPRQQNLQFVHADGRSFVANQIDMLGAVDEQYRNRALHTLSKSIHEGLLSPQTFFAPLFNRYPDRYTEPIPQETLLTVILEGLTDSARTIEELEPHLRAPVFRLVFTHPPFNTAQLPQRLAHSIKHEIHEDLAYDNLTKHLDRFDAVIDSVFLPPGVDANGFVIPEMTDEVWSRYQDYFRELLPVFQRLQYDGHTMRTDVVKNLMNLIVDTPYDHTGTITPILTLFRSYCHYFIDHEEMRKRGFGTALIQEIIDEVAGLVSEQIGCTRENRSEHPEHHSPSLFIRKLKPDIAATYENDHHKEELKELFYDVAGESLNPFLNDTDDLVFIHAYNRPELICQQILAYIANREAFRGQCGYTAQPPFDTEQNSTDYYDRKILFAVVDDSDADLAKTTVYRDLLTEMVRSLPAQYRNLYRIAYVDKLRQNVLVNTYPVLEDMTCYVNEPGSRKMGGVRGMQNISELLAYYYGSPAYAHGKNPVVYKLNDDGFPFAIRFQEKTPVVYTGFDFFAHNGRLLEKQNYLLIGAHVDGNSPSPIYTLAEWIETLNSILKSGNTAGLPADLHTIEFQQVPPWMQTAIHQYLFTPGMPAQTDPLDSFLHQYLLPHLQQIRVGINCMTVDSTTDALQVGYFGPIGSLSGDAIAHRLSSVLPPMPVVANQDILLSGLLHGLHPGEVASSGSVLHMKNTNRPAILSDLAGGLSNPRHSFLLSCLMLSEMEYWLHTMGKSQNTNLPKHKTVGNEFIHFGGQEGEFINRIFKHTEELLSMIAEYSDSPPDLDWKNTMEQLEVFLRSIQDQRMQILGEFAPTFVSTEDKVTAARLFYSWISGANKWFDILDYYRGLGQNIFAGIPKSHENAIFTQQDRILDRLPERDTVYFFSPPSITREHIRTQRSDAQIS
jgi:hypothetical protein